MYEIILIIGIASALTLMFVRPSVKSDMVKQFKTKIVLKNIFEEQVKYIVLSLIVISWIIADNQMTALALLIIIFWILNTVVSERE